ncbi:MAG: CoA pyrophosphatase [Anaerolineae bacterium]|nr:CoA pyrophosphatase [Anaerolineae bacterium]
MAPEQRAMRRSSRRAGEPRRASVLILLFPGNRAAKTEAGLTFALIQRTTNPHDRHSGQISLPGGAQEPGETVIETALRETREELGVMSPVQILGTLTCLYILHSDFEVRPVVGYVPEHPQWQPDAAEVVEVIECPLAWLLDDDRKVVEHWTLDGQTRRVPWYDVQGRKVWGATAMMLSEFEHRLKYVLASNG